MSDSTVDPFEAPRRRCATAAMATAGPADMSSPPPPQVRRSSHQRITASDYAQTPAEILAEWRRTRRGPGRIPNHIKAIMAQLEAEKNPPPPEDARPQTETAPSNPALSAPVIQVHATDTFARQPHLPYHRRARSSAPMLGSSRHPKRPCNSSGLARRRWQVPPLGRRSGTRSFSGNGGTVDLSTLIPTPAPYRCATFLRPACHQVDSLCVRLAGRWQLGSSPRYPFQLGRARQGAARRAGEAGAHHRSPEGGGAAAAACAGHRLFPL